MRNNLNDLFQILTKDTVVLTPNRRLSAKLHQLYQQQQCEQHQAWITPTILPLISWMHVLWNQHILQQCETFPLLLNTSQEQLIWEKILLYKKENEQLLQLSEAAELARSAWYLLNQWQVDLEHPLFASTEDSIALRQWLSAYQQECAKHHYIDNAVLPNLLIERMQFALPKNIVLFGFTEYSPQINHFLNTCKAAGSQIIDFQYTTNSSHCQRINLVDQEDEIQTMARWAKSILAAHPTASIGCVIPSLDKIRDRVAQQFSEVFAEENTYTIDTQHSSFNISAGKNLAQYPIIHTALQLLLLHKNKISTEALSHILCTPFAGEAESERLRRAHFDSQLRSHNKNMIMLDTACQEELTANALSLTKYCPQLAKRVRAFLNKVNEHQEKTSYSEWAMHFHTYLTILGWPGERSLNSEEYQIVSSWLNLLNQYKTLDQIATPVHLSQALSTLQKMAHHSVFQPQSPEAPIQVLGILEAAALPFDYVWIAGMDDLAWPPAPKPNPFIPKRLQRELKMPHATAERELTFCSEMTKQFKQSAHHTIFSYAEKNKELELQPSSLIKDLTLIKKTDLRLEEYHSPQLRVFQSKQLETLIDESAPPVISDEKIRGGVNVIKQQALCPFKSFAEWRLHARELESPLPGLRAKDRGTLLHKVLELVWNQLQTQAKLIEIEDEDLYHIITNCIDHALSNTQHNEFIQYISLEKKRLYQLVRSWLQIEKERSPFKILMNEKSVPFTLGNISLTLRVDRIDELENGKKLIIDYKSGRTHEINHWFGDRPEEPQLPLYILLDPENTIGISFAQLYPGEYGFKGVSHYALDIDGIKLISEIKKTTALSWSEQITQWEQTLIKLSNEFHQGYAAVDPKNPPQTCVWCALKPLCRVNES